MVYHYYKYGNESTTLSFQPLKPFLSPRCDWHAAVPQLVATFQESPESFRHTLKSLKGLRGSLAGSGRDSDGHLVMTWVWWVNHDLTMKHDIFIGFHHCWWWFYKDLTVSGSNSWDLFESTSGQKLTEDPQLSHVYMGLTPSTSGFYLPIVEDWCCSCSDIILCLRWITFISEWKCHFWNAHSRPSWLHKPSSHILFIDFVRILTVW